MLKKVVLHSVATALANNVFPVPLIKWQQGMYSDKTVSKNVGRNNNVCNGLKVGLKLKVFYSLLAFFEAKLNVTCVVV